MIQRTRRKRMNKEEIEKIIKEYLKENLRLETRLEYLDEYIKEIAEMMGFGICLVRDYYNNYRNLTQGTHYYIHSKRKNKS